MLQLRRSFALWLLRGGLTASAASFLYPVLRFMMPPEVPEVAVNEVRAGKTSEWAPDSGRIVRFGNRPVLLIRTSETEWRAFSAVCTHLNCTVQYQPGQHQIWCACHNGLYDLNGKVVSGPPPRPLEELAVHVRGEEVVVARRA